MKHRWSITDACPLPAAFEETLGVMYLSARGNAYPLEEAAQKGWIEEIDIEPVVLTPDPVWDIEIWVDDRFQELRGDTERVLPESLHASMVITKDSDVVLAIKDVKTTNFTSNPELLAEMLNILNGFEQDSEGNERAS